MHRKRNKLCQNRMKNSVKLQIIFVIVTDEYRDVRKNVLMFQFKTQTVVLNV